MATLIQTFTFDRNTLKRNAQLSAEAVFEHIHKVEKQETLDKTASNIVGALANYMGVFKRTTEGQVTTKVAHTFLDLYALNAEDAFRWLLTRSLWRFHIPNGTACKANELAVAQGISFSFFSTFLELLTHLQSLPGHSRYLFYDELCELFAEDKCWTKGSLELFQILIGKRNVAGLPKSPKKLLEELEPKYGIPRDNLNGLLNKAFYQTGFFEFLVSSDAYVAISLNNRMDVILQERLRYILDHPLKLSTPATWDNFLELKEDDLPQKAGGQRSLAIPRKEYAEPLPVDKLLSALKSDFDECGLKLISATAERFVASLLTKRFVILTGLSGSGKTKLAQGFATWISPRASKIILPFIPGTEIPSEKISYYVHAEDSVSVEFWNSKDPKEATRVVLPKDMIVEWAYCILNNGFTRNTSAREIREVAKKGSKFSDQLHSFETHLKAAAFHFLENQRYSESETCLLYEIVAVGADWTTNENLFGYADALSPGDYRMPENRFLELLIAATRDPERPYFLILDEMNLSHVERYFSYVLSAMESGEVIRFHEDRIYPGKDWGGIPTALGLPDNLFIIGTVNIDETTYMFSPKVLDRANVLEFRVDEDSMSSFLQGAKRLRFDTIEGNGQPFSYTFLEASRIENTSLEIVYKEDYEGIPVQDEVTTVLRLLFDQLAPVGAEFGYRSASEIMRFIYFYKLIDSTVTIDKALDAAIIQKLLPKLHGSTRKLAPVLQTMEEVCEKKGYLISLEKIKRMAKRLDQNGFTSFAEA